MAMPAGYKPSPLGYGSPRSSPFRRPESPVSPSPLRQSTPTASPFKDAQGGGAADTPFSRFALSSASTPASSGSWTPRNQNTPLPSTVANSRPTPSTGGLGSPARVVAAPASAAAAPRPLPTAPAPTSLAQGTALSQLQPAQVRTLREAFHILDRDSDGTVNRDDVADMLSQLGLPATPSDVSQFFPRGAPQTITMGVFLNSLAAALAALSPSTELLSALSAFDEDDSGQVDLAELREALLNTPPEPGERPLTEAEIHHVMQGFTGRRAFTNSSNRSMKGSSGGAAFAQKRGEVFKYQDFVQSIAGGSQGGTAEVDAEAGAAAET